ncbi:hypothetical protein SprV_0100263100 [Sparganum proliferum]
MKTGAAIFEANRITTNKAERETRKSQLPPPHNANAQPSPTCPRCQRHFDLSDTFGPTAAPGLHQPSSPSTSPSPPTPSTNADRPSQPSLPSSSSSTASTPTDVAYAMPINTTHNPVLTAISHSPHALV